MEDFQKRDIERIKKIIGKENTVNISNNDEGVMSRAYILKDLNLVFKFARYQASIEENKNEIRTLSLIKDISFNIEVPKIKYYDSTNEYIGYIGVKGNMLKYNEDKVTDKELVGKQIGDFLKQFHSLKPYEDIALMNTEFEIKRFQERFSRRYNELKNYLNESQLSALSEFYKIKMPQKMLKLGEKLVLSHGDLGYYNILISDNNKISIIDFGDSGLYDESSDFVRIEDNLILESAIKAYGDTKLLRDKISIRRKAYPILEIDHYFDVNETDKIGKWVNTLKNNLKID